MDAQDTSVIYLCLGVLLSPDLPSLRTRMTRSLDDPVMIDLKRQLMTAFNRHRSFAIAVDSASDIETLQRGEFNPNTQLLDGHHRLAIIRDEQLRHHSADERGDESVCQWYSSNMLVNVLVFVVKDWALRIATAYGELNAMILK
jgi:hypothetical protein